jgi:hypothetical protein
MTMRPLELMVDARFGELAAEAATKLQAAVDDIGARAAG